jgi:hypothetical protein
MLPTLLDGSSPAAMGERALTIGVGPVTRPQIVTRLTGAEKRTNLCWSCL